MLELALYSGIHASSCGTLQHATNAPPLAAKALANPARLGQTEIHATYMLGRDSQLPRDCAVIEPRERAHPRPRRSRIRFQFEPSESGKGLYAKPRSMSTTKTKIRGTPEVRLEIGRAFRSARLEAGMNQTELAKSLTVSQDSVSAWERGAIAPPIEAVRALGRLVSPFTRGELFQVTGITDDAAELLRVRSETRKIALLHSSDQLGHMEPAVEKVLTVPSEWFPEDANVKAIKLAEQVSPIFGDEVIAFVDLAHRDADKLENAIVIARTPRGNAPMKLRRAGRTFFLTHLSDEMGRDLHPLEHDGNWSIVGQLIRWFASAPMPAGR